MTALCTEDAELLSIWKRIVHDDLRLARQLGVVSRRTRLAVRVRRAAGWVGSTTLEALADHHIFLFF
jgi:hypothetical protein